MAVKHLGEIQMQAATLFLCEFVRWHSEQKMAAESLVRFKLAEYSEKLGRTDDATETLAQMVMSIACVMKDGSAAGDLRQAA